MGFGSYDESEQKNQEFDTNTDIDDDARSTLAAHDGEVEFEYDDASSEDLLETFEEIKGE